MAQLIPVVLQNEPADFDRRVRKPGHKWLKENQIKLHQAPPDSSALPKYWSKTNKQLWIAYSGVCAYLAIYFEWATGASSTDHFVAKSKNADSAYEWDNYRLSCLGANRNKNKFDDVLDPVGLPPNTFFLDLTTGEITANPHINPNLKADVSKTIDRLKLNSAECKKMRADHFVMYLEHKHAQTLKKLSPFVWHEADRQKLL